MLKLGCTLPKLANNRLHKCTDANFNPFTDGDKDLFEKTQEKLVDGSYIVFTQKAVVDEIFTRKSTNLYNFFVRIDASLL